MTRLLTDEGNYIPVTVVRALPNTIMQLKTPEKDGYAAFVQSIVKQRTDGRRQALYSGEFRVTDPAGFERGMTLGAENFPEAKVALRVTGVSKGKGFQGPMKRHNFSGHPASHGAQYHRTGGSVGTRKPRRVKPGKKMAGHMGVDTITLRDVPIEKIDIEGQLLALRGPLPGATNSYLRLELDSAPAHVTQAAPEAPAEPAATVAPAETPATADTPAA